MVQPIMRLLVSALVIRKNGTPKYHLEGLCCTWGRHLHTILPAILCNASLNPGLQDPSACSTLGVVCQHHAAGLADPLPGVFQEMAPLLNSSKEWASCLRAPTGPLAGSHT